MRIPRFKMLHKVFALVTVWVVTTGAQCIPLIMPSEGLRHIEMPFYTQLKNWYCVPAVIQMWREKLHGPNASITQDVIWNWFVTNRPGSAHAFWPGGGITDQNAIQDALSIITGAGIYDDVYEYADRQQAVADQAAGIANDRPTAVGINDVTHFVLVTGAQWHKLADAIQRPRGEFIELHDPLKYAYFQLSVGTWMNSVIPSPRNSNRILQYQYAGQRNLASNALDSFDGLGGTYLGPGPSNPTGRYRYDGNGNCYWEPSDFGKYQCLPGEPPPPPGGANVLEPGERLYPGNSVDSPDGRFHFTYQGDGNLVLYGPPGAIWATMTFDSPGYLEMQGDGNVVMYNSGGVPIWHTATSGNSGARLVVQSDGNVVVYYNGFAAWYTNTGGW